MPIGNVTETIQDGGLGIVPANTANQRVLMGVSTGGTANTLYSFSSNDDIKSTLISGPLAEAAAYELSISGGSVFAMPINASVVGVASSVTPTRVGSSTGTVTATGTPNDAYSVQAKIVSAGTAQLVTSGTVQVQISLDGGTTFGQAALIPTSGTFVVTGTGLTLTFSVTTTNFDFGDVFSLTCQAPFYGATDLNNAFTALLADPRTWGWVHVIGYPTVGSSTANATASATLAATIAAQMATAEAAFRYCFAIMEAPASLDADLISAFASFASSRVKVEAGTDVLNSVLNGRKLTRSHAWALSGRLGKIRVSQSPGAFADGPMPGIVSINRDERKTPALFDQRFGVSLTYLGQAGFYSDIGKMMAAAGSDFSLVMNRRVMDQASTLSRAALMKYLNSSVRVKSDGTIIEADARGIEKDVENTIRGQMSQDISDVTVTVNRADNILSTQLLRVKTRVTPVGYAGSISEDIGFVNPALVLT